VAPTLAFVERALSRKDDQEGHVPDESSTCDDGGKREKTSTPPPDPARAGCREYGDREQVWERRRPFGGLARVHEVTDALAIRLFRRAGFELEVLSVARQVVGRAREEDNGSRPEKDEASPPNGESTAVHSHSYRRGGEQPVLDWDRVRSKHDFYFSGPDPRSSTGKARTSSARRSRFQSRRRIVSSISSLGGRLGQ
jgi:hypothetical protein